MHLPMQQVDKSTFQNVPALGGVLCSHTLRSEPLRERNPRSSEIVCDLRVHLPSAVKAKCLQAYVFSLLGTYLIEINYAISFGHLQQLNRDFFSITFLLKSLVQSQRWI